MATTEDITRRIRGLLAKAESTDQEGEAAAFMAKAQELMLKYAIEEAQLAKADPNRRTRPIVKEIRLGKNKTGIKALRSLLAGIAATNRCNVWMLKGREVLKIAGFEEDVQFVEMLFASIQVQMAAACNEALRNDVFVQVQGAKTFQVNYMYGYVSRVNGRLRANQRLAVEAQGTGNAIVLLDRKAEVDEVTPTGLRKGPPARNRNDFAARNRGMTDGDRADIAGGRNRIQGGTMELGR